MTRLPGVVHTIRDLRAYEHAKDSKRSQAGRLLQTLDEVEYYVGKLKRERRDGHLLVPRRLVQVNRKLMKFCREQANKAVEYNYRMASADRKYTMKHGFYMMFNLYDKKEQLALVMSDCRLWLTVSFHTISL